MIRVLLSPSQREELFQIPADITEQALIKQYAFSAPDLALIKMQREERNRLGFGVQLAYFRFPGRPLQAGETPPRRFSATLLPSFGSHRWRFAAMRSGTPPAANMPAKSSTI